MTMDLHDYIASIPDFPQPGITFRDITPLLADTKAFGFAIHELAEYANEKGATKIVAPESRGFLLGTPMALEMGVGFVPARKPGKLPRKTISESYTLEYGSATLELNADAIEPGDKVVVVDDLLATGGTIAATNKLIERLGGEVVGLAFLIELTELQGRQVLKDYDIRALLTYEGE
ncbi:adenine phosphoribosyltransferase [Weissella coleopterorum]|uniref:Adenine phosphoribosyltransferase n=1 Tax=Weissella coleopterorum TaxID=2714949 RepID=A0A6G8B0Y0_9LACO|nr:adenine phosphoribosyltransferase [Weissella coleopterorum]QIL50906.1 adenine phosphoribosyltransferase [Weissella coleopterorum]